MCFLQDKNSKEGETLKKKIAADSDDEGSSSDSSEDESPRALSYRSPFFTQVYIELYGANHILTHKICLQI